MPDAPSDLTERRTGRSRVRASFKALVLAIIAVATAYSAVRMAGHVDGGPQAASTVSQRAVASASARAARRSAPALVGAPTSRVPDGVRYLFIGGGPVPESTEVSLEQDLVLARRVLPEPGLALFAGGTGTLSVRELDPDLKQESLLTRLGDLFQPRSGRKSRYRASAEPAGAATRIEVERALSVALAQQGAPLTVYVAAHGEKGTERRGNYIVLWGDEALTVADVARIQRAHSRPMRLVAATCFSGGFADLAFERADETQGATHADRCGLFASTWDREASGCDPNPDRRAQESYSLHMLSALGGTGPHGAALDRSVLDLDGDGAISLLEAHTRARIASRSIDIPTTTSERLLRVLQKVPGPPAVDMLPEEVAVVDALSRELGLPSSAAAKARWKVLDSELSHLEEELDDAEDDADESYRSLRALLLSRWPVLDDPYHPAFARTLAEHEKDIRAALDETPEGAAHLDAQRRLRSLDDEFSERLVPEALVQRLVRAHETLALAGGLRLRGGEALGDYERMLACERGRP
jgi:hypothetical protein